MVNRSIRIHNFVSFFFFNDTETTYIYTLSLHDALPIWPPRSAPGCTSTARHCCRRAPCSWSDRKSTRLNSSHMSSSYDVFCLKKKIREHFENCGTFILLIRVRVLAVNIEDDLTDGFQRLTVHHDGFRRQRAYRFENL